MADRLARWGLAGAAALLAYAIQGPGPVSAALITLAVAAALVITPRHALPSIAVLSVRGLGVPELAAPLIGQMRLTDLCLILFVYRSVVAMPCRRWDQPAHTLIGLLFVGWSLAVTTIHDGSVTPLLRIAVYIIAGYFVARTPAARSLLEYSVIGYACVEIMLSLPEIPNRLYGSTIGDPGQFGDLMLVAAIIAAFRIRTLAIRVPVLALVLTGVVFCQTRSVWFAAAAVLIVLVFRTRGRLTPIAVPALAAAIALPFVPWITQTLQLNAYSPQLRIDTIRSGLDAIRSNPLFGHGWAYHATATVWPGEDVRVPYNIWVFVMASAGFIGLCLFVAWVVLLARDLGRVDIVGYAVLTVMLAIGLSEMPVYAHSLMTIIFVLLSSPRPDYLEAADPLRVRKRAASVSRLVSNP